MRSIPLFALGLAVTMRAAGPAAASPAAAAPRPAASPPAAPSAAGGGDLCPLATTYGLSSGFGEFRDAHFHAGLDYSTDEREGRPVRAVNDGWVERVRASGVGYGRAVYLRLRDGRTAVYGHLSRYAPSIDAYVAAAQDSAGVYEQDLYPKAGQLPFKRGEVLAWSGQSGAGPPHLHFEIRRGDENFNPLLHGYALPDHVAPTLAAAWITPHGARSRVAGGIDAVRVPLPAPGRVATAPPVRGPFDLALDTWDRADGRPNKLATYRLEARLDGQPAFLAVTDSFSWDTTVEVERVYDYAATLAGDDTRRTLALLPSYRESVVRQGPSVWALAPGVHRFELTATDEAGNTTRAWLDVPVVDSVASASAAAAPAPTRRAARRGGAPRPFPPEGEIRGTVFYARADSEAPRGVTLVDSLERVGSKMFVYQVTGADGRMFGAPSLVRPDSTRVDLDVLAAGGGGFFLLDDLDSTLRVSAGTHLTPVLEFPAHSAYEPCAVRVVQAPPPDPTDELIPSNIAWRIDPADLALRRPSRVRIDRPFTIAGRPGVTGPGSLGARAGLFLRQSKGWSFLAAIDRANGFDATTRRLGTLAVFADTTRPTIAAPPSYRWRQPVARGARTGAAASPAPPPRLFATIRDRGAGLAPRDQAIFVDGRRVPAEYDPESSRLTWYPRAWLAAGAHVVRIEATDRLGNRAVRTVPLVVN